MFESFTSWLKSKLGKTTPVVSLKELDDRPKASRSEPEAPEEEYDIPAVIRRPPRRPPVRRPSRPSPPSPPPPAPGIRVRRLPRFDPIPMPSPTTDDDSPVETAGLLNDAVSELALALASADDVALPADSPAVQDTGFAGDGGRSGGGGATEPF